MGNQNNLLQALIQKLISLEGGTVTFELRRFTMQNIPQLLLISYFNSLNKTLSCGQRGAIASFQRTGGKRGIETQNQFQFSVSHIFSHVANPLNNSMRNKRNFFIGKCLSCSYWN